MKPLILLCGAWITVCAVLIVLGVTGVLPAPVVSLLQGAAYLPIIALTVWLSGRPER